VNICIFLFCHIFGGLSQSVKSNSGNVKYGKRQNQEPSKSGIFFKENFVKETLFSGIIIFGNKKIGNFFLEPFKIRKRQNQDPLKSGFFRNFV